MVGLTLIFEWKSKYVEWLHRKEHCINYAS